MSGPDPGAPKGSAGMRRRVSDVMTTDVAVGWEALVIEVADGVVTLAGELEQRTDTAKEGQGWRYPSRR
jgi:osmotically-inducible protein OsmY